MQNRPIVTLLCIARPDIARTSELPEQKRSQVTAQRLIGVEIDYDSISRTEAETESTVKGFLSIWNLTAVKS